MKPKHFEVNYADWKKSLPQPVFEEHPEYLKLYERAWELAHDHILDTPGLPQHPYMDEAFANTDIWIWDTCFMMFFCKYAPDVFPGIESLQNFYSTLLDGAPMPIVKSSRALYEKPVGSPIQMCVHIPDNPPLFAWAELNYAMSTGDLAHLRTLVKEKQYLQKYFDMFENFEPGWKTPYTRAEVCLKKHPDGYFWEGGRSGMDNTPRGRKNGKAEQERPNNPDLLWIDAICQQTLAAGCIAKIAELLGDSPLAEKWNSIRTQFAAKVNQYYWDEKDGMYYDILASTHEFLKVLTPASFWTLLAGIPSAEQVERMIHYLTDPQKLGGIVPWVTISRDDPDFHPDYGDYWRGSVWLPTAYMGIKGLEKYGKFELAEDQARKILEHMYCTWRDFEPHTIWECYSPTKRIPARHGSEIVRPDFCGWSALGPISLFIENVIGITGADSFRNTVAWHLPKQTSGKFGIRNFTFGDTTADLICDGKTIEVSTDRAFTLIVDGKEYPVSGGASRVAVK